MFVKQVSIFLENQPGRIYDVIKLLGKNNIDIKALSIADTDQFGIARLILNKPNTAVNILKENNFIVKINDVIAITVSNEPGGLIDALSLLYDNNIGIEYMYAFVGDSDINASVILKVDKMEDAFKLFDKNGIKLLSSSLVHEKD